LEQGDREVKEGNRVAFAGGGVSAGDRQGAMAEATLWLSREARRVGKKGFDRPVRHFAEKVAGHKRQPRRPGLHRPGRGMSLPP